ncbi:hypothetical protein C7S18_17765 [Ahniella affigens]|uniref:Uncharacterized protein n=1 Tax=Ahniella affigens TaxID=2021234 RepID=A0A2P1PVR1_9GAMM|nr:hypothetical protein [Ahniella affigens]AVP98912.1 hypothetical protein C7S18_17765 [Ahniella affigens]
MSLIGFTSGDYAPKRIGFKLTTHVPAGQSAISLIEIDFNGDGNFEITTTDAGAPLAFDFTSPSVSLARARVTFDDGNSGTSPVVSESTFRVQMSALAYARESLCNLYYTMKHRLQAQDISGALNTVLTQDRADWQSAWQGLGVNLSTAANGLGEVVSGRISSSSADFVVATPDTEHPGDYAGFPLQFKRESTGVWRISEM